MGKKNIALSTVLATLDIDAITTLLAAHRKEVELCKEIIDNLQGFQVAGLLKAKVRGIKADILATRVDALLYMDDKTIARIYNKHPEIATTLLKDCAKPQERRQFILNEDMYEVARDVLMTLLTPKRVGTFAESLSKVTRKVAKLFATDVITSLPESRSRKTIMKAIAKQWIPFLDKKALQAAYESGANIDPKVFGLRVKVEAPEA